MDVTPGADPESEAREPGRWRDLSAVACLAVAVLAATVGGFCVSPATGFYSLAAGLLVAAWLLGGDTAEPEPGEV